VGEDACLRKRLSTIGFAFLYSLPLRTKNPVETRWMLLLASNSEAGDCWWWWETVPEEREYAEFEICAEMIFA
jgi:hypothetical protein